MRKYTGTVLLFAAFATGCAAPRTAQPPPPLPVETPAPPATGEEVADYPLPDVRAEAALARYSPLIEAAHPSGRPGILLSRAGKAIDEAQRLRKGKMEYWNILSLEDELHFAAYYDSAERDCREILEGWPEAPEAAEAQYTLGLIHDYPHMTEFPKADAEYLLTIEGYPGTEAAVKAESRVRQLRSYIEKGMPDPQVSPPTKVR